MASLNDIIERADQKSDTKERPPRPALTWADVHEVQKEAVRVIVSSANNGRYNVYSYRVLRVDRPTPNIGVRTTMPTFTSPAAVEIMEQAEHVYEAIKEAFLWINAQLEEAHAQKAMQANQREAKKDSFGGPAAPRKTGKTERDREKKKNRA